jgi:quinolinate synthase
MAETAKVLNPERIVVVPDQNAGCSLVDSCPVEDLRAWKRANPEYAIVSYINTSVEVKAESDILCTSRNAVKIVNSIAERAGYVRPAVKGAEGAAPTPQAPLPSHA